MMSLWERYLMLFSKASSPRSSDCSRGTIYTFEKWCRNCGAGMSKPQRHEQRERKKLYKSSFCSVNCQERGKREVTQRNIKVQYTFRPNISLDDMVMVSKALDEQEAKMPPFVRILKEVDATYNMLSEKLSAMELLTDERWYQSKYFYWLGKALK